MVSESNGRGKHMADVAPDEQGLFTIPEDLGDTADLSEAVVVPDVPKYLLPDRVYDVLKWLVVIVLPALSTLIANVGGKLGIPDPNGVAVVIIEISFFLGACIGASHVSAMGR
jgi:hypothetical protein